ncbi:TPA: host cell division inhibitor Icd-like protein [Shigella flexneri]|nr:host cell division inhibitor Icd-like protein [Shigella flexneri]
MGTRENKSITNNATFAAGGQCDQSDLVRSKVCNESFFLCSLRNFSRANEQGANLSDSCSCAIFLRRLLRVGDGVLVDSVSLMVLSCKAMRLRSSNYGADIGYSCSLTLRRWSSSRATVTSCPISSAALMPICSTLARASSDDTRGFSPLPSAWRRAISPRMAVTINPALLSPSSLTDSIPCITSSGTLTVVSCDFAFLLAVAISETPNHRCVSVYTKKEIQKALTCVSCAHNMKHTERIVEIQRATPRSAGNTYGASNQQRKLGAVMVAVNHIPHLVHTQTAFVWRFLALSAGESQIIHVTAWMEREARSRCPSGCVAVFAAKIRQGVSHA